jgi:hypothetical protein
MKNEEYPFMYRLPRDPVKSGVIFARVNAAELFRE